MFGEKSIFQSSSSMLSLTPIFLQKGSQAALSKDSTLLVSSDPENHGVQYIHLPSQRKKNICTTSVSALCFRPNEKQYQQRGPAREITRNQILIACHQAHQVMSYIPSLDSFLKPILVQGPTALACNATGQLLAVGTEQGYMFVFDMQSHEIDMVYCARPCKGTIEQIMFGTDGEHLFARDGEHNVYVNRLKVAYEEADFYLKEGGSVYLRSRITATTGQPKKITDIARIFPAQVINMGIHPTIRQVALATAESRIYFWNYACATLSYFDCPLQGPLAVFFCLDSDYFLVSGREGLAVYELTRRQKAVANSNCAGGPYPVHYEVVLSAEQRPRIFPNGKPGHLVRAMIEHDGVCITASA